LKVRATIIIHNKTNLQCQYD